jgi:signal transduction histidine kinase
LTPDIEDPMLRQRGFALNSINLVVFGFSIFTALMAVDWIFFGETPAGLASILMLGSAVFIAGFVVVIFFTAKGGRVHIGSVALYVLLIIAMTFSDIPEEVLNGRSLYTFLLPILVAGFTADPVHAFVAAGASSIAIGLLDIFTVQLGINWPAIGIYFTAAAVTYLFAQNVNKTIRQLIDEERVKMKFIEDISHELRSPLGFLFGHIEMFRLILNLEVYKQVENQTEYELNESILEIHEATGRLVKLTDSMLDLLELQKNAIPLEDIINLSQVTDEAASEFHGLASEKGLKLDLIAKERELLVRGNYSRIRQVVKVLVDNAIKYTSEGEISIHIDKKNDYAEIIIADTGPGIKEEDKELVFTQLYRGDAGNTNVSGTGLGLSIAKEIVRIHKGHITLESDVGEGSIFTVALPLTHKSKRGN